MARDPVAALPPGEIQSTVTMIQTTIAELGDTLPHGDAETRRPVSFRFRPPTMGTKKQLGALNANKELRKYPARHIASYLGTALEVLDGKEMSSLKPDARAETVARLTIGDVLYLMLRWQYLTNPRGLNLGESRCGSCNRAFDAIQVDVGSLPVTVPGEDGVVPLARVGLRHGFAFAGAQVGTVEVKAPTWYDVWWELAQANWSNPELIAALTFKASICGVDSSGIPRLTDDAIDGIWPEDQELIDEALERVQPSPNLEIEVECPSETCKARNYMVIDWMNPDFLSGRARA